MRVTCVFSSTSSPLRSKRCAISSTRLLRNALPSRTPGTEHPEAKEQKKLKVKDDACAEHDRKGGVLQAWAAVTGKHSFLSGAHSEEELKSMKSVPELKTYIEMHSTGRPKSQMSRPEAEEVAVALLRKGEGVRLQQGSLPEGYAEYKERERERLLTLEAPAAGAPLLLEGHQGRTTNPSPARASTPTPPKGRTGGAGPAASQLMSFVSTGIA